MSQPLLPSPQYQHLELERAEPEERRWKPRPPGRAPRDNSEYGLALQAAASSAVQQAAAQWRPEGVDPALVLRVRTTTAVNEDEWRRDGFQVVGSEANKVLILFSDDTEMTRFQDRVAAYQAGRRTHGQDRPDYAAWAESIDPEGIGPLGPEDRTGRLLRELIAAGGPEPDVPYWLDVELWHLGTPEACDAKLNELGRFVQARNGRLTDQLVRDGICLARVQVSGAVVRDLLAIPSIATVDLPPRPAFSIAHMLATPLDALDPVEPPAADAPQICVIDSGIARGHPLLQDAIGETIAVPNTLGDGLDVNGHGSRVTGVALYGDVEACRVSGTFRQTAWINGARVTNADNEFDDERLIPGQMREAIEYFASLGCRIFNISLGDARRPYEGGKPTAWAATLDNLAHEHDLLIVVSAGNYDHQETAGVSPDEMRRGYPGYLLGDPARIIEPATAANVLTVGALAREGQPAISQQHADDVSPIPIAGPDQPSPFTRCGPGVRRAVKPELVEYGGNYSFNARLNRVSHDLGLAVVSLNRDFIGGGLFAFDHGTSYAAPRVAHLAAQILAEYPHASANLLRALLVHSAALPLGVESLPLDKNCRRQICGYGRPDLERALYSTDGRVVMLTENELPLDWFHVYRVPNPAEIRETRGRRRVAVTLAFDPPVRHQRAEYLGSSMAFRLIRGETLDKVVSVYRATASGERKAKHYKASCNCSFDLGPSVRDPGSVQHGVWHVSQNRALDFDEPLYLVVLNERGWQRGDDIEQRYAVVVSLEHDAPLIELYAPVRQQTRVSQRARIRA